MFTVFTPFFTLGPGSTTLYSTNALSHGLISSTTFLQHSTVYSSTAVLQSTTSTQHPSGGDPGVMVSRTPTQSKNVCISYVPTTRRADVAAFADFGMLENVRCSREHEFLA